MRALLVSSHGADVSFGGAERYVADLGRGLRARGHDVTVLSAFPVERDGSGCRTLALHGSDWRRDPGRRLRNHAGDLVAIPGRRLLDAVRSAGPDLVHTSNLPGITTAVWEICRRLGIPVVHTLHDYYLLCPRVTLERPDGAACRPHPLLCGLRTRRLVRWAGAVQALVAGSEHLLRVHDGLLPTADPHVIRLPLSPVADRRLAPPRAPLRSLGYLGALERSKGVASLLAAAPSLARLGVVLRIAGDGRLRAAVEAASGPGLQYAGRVGGEQKVAFLESSDLGLVPSLWAEPSGPPYTVLEWLAAGRPVLTSGRGGLGELQATPGVVEVDPDPAGIAHAVGRLLDDGTWREMLAGVEQARDTRDVERWLDQHEAVYRQAST